MEKLSTTLDQRLAGIDRRRLLSRAGAVSLGAVAAWLGLSASSLTGTGRRDRAYAASGDVIFACVGTATAFFNPAVTNTLQTNITVQDDATFVGCVPPGSGIPVVTMDYAGHMDASCSFEDEVYGTAHIRYGSASSLSTSTWNIDDFTIIRQVGQIIGVTSGTITSGSFSGALARNFYIRADVGACTSPISGSGGTDVLVVTEQ